MQSAPALGVPGIQSFSFVGTAYTSRYVTFSGVELYSDSIDSDGAFTRIATLTAVAGGSHEPLRHRVPDRADGPAPSPSSTSATDGDLDVRVQPGSDPGPLAVGHRRCPEPPHDAAGQAIVASANYLTAGICLATGQQPAAVCSSKGCGPPTTPSGPADIGAPVPPGTRPDGAGTNARLRPSRVSRPGGPSTACAPSRSGRPRCREARGCGWRSRGTRHAPTHDRQIDLARSSR